MGSSVPIVEVLSDGRYELKEEVLSGIASAAKECQNLSLISIIGQDRLQNEFIYSCLTNYLESQYRDVWPQQCERLDNVWSSDGHISSPLVRMWSKPFILKDDDQSTAVFLMDTIHIFDKQNELFNSKLTKDIMDLFCATSSTLIYLKAEQLVVSYNQSLFQI